MRHTSFPLLSPATRSPLPYVSGASMSAAWLSAALLSAALLFGACGCRQTTGPTFGGLNPTGGLAPATGLTPVAPGQSPNLLGPFGGTGPFGGATRVTPPPTGSFSPGNGTLGSIAPTSGYGPPAAYAPQDFGAQNFGTQNFGTQNFGTQGAGGAGRLADQFANSGSQPIGSGVLQTSAISSQVHAGNQQAGWTETGTTISGQSGAFAPTAPPFAHSNAGFQPQSTSDLRSGGMQVIDLTGSSDSGPSNPAPGLRGGGSHQVFQSPPMPQPSLLPQHMPNPGTIASQPLGVTNPRPIASFPTTRPEFEPRLSPIDQPRIATGTSGGGFPSEPTTTTDGNLNWRRPGSRF